MKRSAVISDDGLYRYQLGRKWDDSLPVLAWIMLNPSTADAEQDDPTIRRCMKFSRDWGYGGIEVANVYAYRTTNPKTLLKIDDPVGPDWAQFMFDLMQSYPIIAAWGTKGGKHGDDFAASLITGGHLMFPPVRCLGTTKAGHPKHPLYMRADTPPVPFRPAESDKR